MIYSRVMRSGIVVCTFLKSAPSLDTAADATTCCSTQNSVWSGPVLIGFLDCLESSASIELKN